MKKIKVSKNDLEIALMDNMNLTFLNLDDGSFTWIDEFDVMEEEWDVIEYGM